MPDMGKESIRGVDNALSELISDLVAANRILADQGVVDGFGHVSVRHPDRPDRYFLSRSMAPALVTDGDIIEFDLDGTPADGENRSVYLERFIHGEIYKRRSDVQSVVHSHSSSVIPYGVTNVAIRPIYHVCGFIGEGIPNFDIRDVGGETNMLISNRELGAALASCLDRKPGALMRGHGSVIVGGAIPQAVYRAVYLEVNARVQAQAMQLGSVEYLTRREAELAAEANDGQVLRPWRLWKDAVMDEWKSHQ